MQTTEQWLPILPAFNPNVRTKKATKRKSKASRLMNAWFYTAIVFFSLSTAWIVWAYQHEGLMIKEIVLSSFIIGALLLMKYMGRSTENSKSEHLQNSEN